MEVCNCIQEHNLLRATELKHEACVTQILNECAKNPELNILVSRQRTQGRAFTPLHNAANDSKILRMLLESKLRLNVHTCNFMGNTALTQAAFAGNEDCIKLLVEHGSNIQHVSCYGVSVLHAAFFSGNIEAMKYLIERGADPHIDVDDPYFRGYIGVAKNHEAGKKFLLSYSNYDLNIKVPCRTLQRPYLEFLCDRGLSTILLELPDYGIACLIDEKFVYNENSL